MSVAIKMLADRASQISTSGLFDAQAQGDVPSPCVSVCRMTPDRSHCEGCFRTLDDIRVWSRADAATRRTIWAQALRRAGLPLPPALQAQATTEHS
ncbi:hypothetical protein GCM10023090_16120 [Acidovorax lacteus]|uniref:DUF1289 domain-containing protein n=2 Tax=Acidovorax lacteus TaxID=1924988 RepID=A0ABP8L8G6_9BURK